MSFQYISCYCLSSVIQVDRFHASSFQYISCYCLSYLRHVYSHLSLNFNTSHVTVYRYHSTSFFFATFISIHLMLLFILYQNYFQTKLFYFNTSHVTVYPYFTKPKYARYFYFNTSHVTVYPPHNPVTVPYPVFQYISCYCLSNELTPFYIFLRI